jgi:hypothetical protein
MNDAETNDLEQNAEQILNDIQKLQQMEKQLFANLERKNLNEQQKQQIVDKMNQLSSMRINLYETLGRINSFYKNAMKMTEGTLKEQKMAIEIIESELNKSKKKLSLLEEERNNKIRLVEINEYYGSKYAEHTELMKLLIYVLVPIILITYLNKNGILPNVIFTVLLIIISFIGGYYFWIRITSILMRDNMDYDAYNWNFNMSGLSTGTATSSDDPWMSTNITMPGTCVGEYCCSSGLKWDDTLNKCVLDSKANDK